ncbi:MAG: RNA polymerase sigma factor [Candidatus Pristimantibacillus lignocellulolyticus]|uniref:RNA polymerase sigma factor n=1 Tax=Candidatus Pristimantibacillus lignocellulolyticus TaxID=2994561 RepID=A0A9J6ZJL8_9BACL|nr:MAG: RNA polymerase sigma factor [Candidatus Pristimantibacillus lignocellulolyticus]
MNDNQIIEKIKQGEQQYFRVLYDRYFEYAVRVSTIILRNQQSSAKDVVQEAFIRVYRKLNQFDMDREFKPWFYTILLNECKRISQKNNDSEVAGEQVVEPLYQDRHPFIEYESLYIAIQQLEEHNRVPVILKYMHDMKDQEIADILQENVNTIKSRLYKARIKLKNLLKHESGGAVQ